MGFRKIKNDSGSRYKWPTLRRRGDGIDLLIDVHDADRLGVGPESRLWVEMEEGRDDGFVCLRVSVAFPEDTEAWKVSKGKFGDLKVTMGHRAIDQEVQGTVPAMSVSDFTDAGERFLVMVFDPANRVEEPVIREEEQLLTTQMELVPSE